MTNKLQRTRKDNVLAGVCGGIARYFNIDVVIVRIIWVISALAGGFGIGTYIICALIIPKEKDDYQERFNDDDESFDDNSESFNEKYEFDDEKDDRSKQYLGLAFIVIGAMMTFKIIFPGFSFRFFWPLLLIGGGLLLLNRRNDNDEEE